MTYSQDWSYECHTCGKLTTRLNTNGDCSRCAQMHDAVPQFPNMECGHCDGLVHVISDQTEYWCWDCNTAYPVSEASPITEDN